MKQVWLIRHGQSTSNAGLVSSYPWEVPLTETGIEQAKVVADLINGYTFDDCRPSINLIVSSVYLRAKQTANYSVDEILKAYSDLNLPMINFPTEEWSVQEFTYLSTEKFKNTSRSQRQTAAEKYWNDLEPNYCDEYGTYVESFADMFNRAANTMDKIKEQKGLTVIFTHGQFMKAIWYQLIMGWRKDVDVKKTMGKYRNFMNAISIPNTGILELHEQEIGWSIQMKTDHIKEITF